MDNTISLYYVTLHPIHLQVAQVFVTVLLGVGILGYAYRRYNEWRGRAYDRFSISRTSVSPTKEGVHLVEIRNIGPVVRLEDAVRGRAVRTSMIAAANRTTYEQPFVAHHSDADAEAMLEAVRDAISWMSADGELAAASGLATISSKLAFTVTATDAGLDHVRSFKVHIVEKASLDIFGSKNSTFVFENGKDHSKRIATMRAIAHAHTRGHCERVIDGRNCLIVGTFVLKVRA
jgi:hypothetical protein